jgi:hypothetical protein
MRRALPGSEYYRGSAPSRAGQPTAGSAHPRALAAPENGQDRDGSRVHCDSLSEGGAQLCPCGIATATPQHFTVASRTGTRTPAQKFPAQIGRVRTAPGPYPPDLSRFTFRGA